MTLGFQNNGIQIQVKVVTSNDVIVWIANGDSVGLLVQCEERIDDVSAAIRVHIGRTGRGRFRSVNGPRFEVANHLVVGT